MSATRDAIIALLPAEIQADPDILETSLGQLITLAGVLHLLGVKDIGKAFTAEDPDPLDPLVDADPHRFFKLIEAAIVAPGDPTDLTGFITALQAVGLGVYDATGGASVWDELQTIAASLGIGAPVNSISHNIDRLADELTTIRTTMTTLDTRFGALNVHAANMVNHLATIASAAGTIATEMPGINTNLVALTAETAANS